MMASQAINSDEMLRELSSLTIATAVQCPCFKAVSRVGSQDRFTKTIFETEYEGLKQSQNGSLELKSKVYE